MEETSTSLVNRQDLVPFNINLCIICQKQNKKKLTSTANGRSVILLSSEKLKDEVYQRLQLVERDFWYHVDNDCYKNYQRRASRIETRIEDKTEDDEQDNSAEPHNKKRRSLLVPREKPSSDQHIHKQTCINCSKTQHKGIRDKHRISESPRAKKFLQAVNRLQDEVFVRVADLDSESRVFGAEIYYHKVCLEGYLQKFDRISRPSIRTTKSSKKRLLFLEEVESIKELIDRGFGIVLSEVRDTINDKNGDDIISNKEVKLFLIEHFGDQIQFVKSERKNEAMMLFSAELTVQDVVCKLRSMNIVKDTAEMIKSALKTAEFGLDGRFCDAQELSHSWKNSAIPDCLILFFSSLFNIPQAALMKNCMQKDLDIESDNNDNIEEEEDISEDSMLGLPRSQVAKSIKIKSLYQIMFYILHNGRKKTPLHTMTGHNVYDRSKSRELITTLNRVGVCSSYNEVRRTRSNLANYCFASSVDGKVPIPSHFVPDKFTLAQMDNFDHPDRSSSSGTMSNHDTVMTLTQIKPDVPPSKPIMKDFDLSRTRGRGYGKLPCQNLINYYRKSKDLPLPAEFSIKDTEVEQDSDIRDKDFILGYIRGLSGAGELSIPTWAGCESIVSNENLAIMQVAFLPYLPYPVTDFATVYTALRNLQSVLQQLNQKYFPLVCDEGVFRIVAEITLQRPDEFRNIVPMLGNFHFAKAVQHCIGKLLKGTGLSDALVETKAFGLKTIETVLAGTHYVRSLRGLLIISEVIETLQWEAFWLAHGRNDYDNILPCLDSLKAALEDHDKVSKSNLLKSIQAIEPLRRDFDDFCQKASDKSEICRYFEILKNNIIYLKQLIAADRNGQWNLHLKSVESLLPLFAECDSINYLRYGSLYLECMKKLPESHPEVYAEFLFVVKTNPGRFNAVAPDMKLEQTIQRSKKCSSGIIGQTRQVDYVSEWEVVYHEVLSISNAFRNLTMSNIGSRECELHHELGGHHLMNYNKQLLKVTNFVRGRGNPFVIGQGNPSTGQVVKLHNIFTGASVVDLVAERLLNFSQNSVARYKEFRKERFVEKSKSLSATIKKALLPQFSSVPEKENKKSTNTEQGIAKEIAQSQKLIDIAKSRNISTAEILEFDLLQSSPLFDGDFPSKPSKSALVTELESEISSNEMQFNKFSSNKTVLIIDFMSIIRRLPLQSDQSFEELFAAAWNVIKSVTRFDQLHVVYDSYIDGSIKYSERTRRNLAVPLDFYGLHLKSKMPVQSDRFWAADLNKQQIQILSREYFKNIARDEGLKLILSGYVDHNQNVEPCLKVEYCSDSAKYEITPVEELLLPLEEADTRIIPHLFYSTSNGYDYGVVGSNDADVIALLSHYLPNFTQAGLKELWVLYGTGDHKRYLPLHNIAKFIGYEKCSVVMKAHILTGCDVTSKIGTKAAALQCEPEKFITQFGDEQSPIIQFLKAEEYLVKVFKRKTKCKTFNELRLEQYTKKSSNLLQLPPTSLSIQGHLKRCEFVIRQNTSLLSNFDDDPCQYGWVNEGGFLLPEKFQNSMPAYFTVRCGCKSKCSGRCKCSKYETICTEFCGCKGQCENV